MSPTQRTLAQLRSDGWALVDVVERWIPRARVRKDLWGFVDVLAVGDGVLGVQATSRGNVSSRVRKIEEHPALPIVREAGIRIEVWGWGKMASGRWECRIVDLS